MSHCILEYTDQYHELTRVLKICTKSLGNKYCFNLFFISTDLPEYLYTTKIIWSYSFAKNYENVDHARIQRTELFSGYGKERKFHFTLLEIFI